MSVQTRQPQPGDEVYVKPAFEPVREAKIIAVGERYEVRLLANGQTRSIRPSNVWSAPESDYSITPIHE